MKSSYVLTELSTGQVKLGRLVTNMWTPHIVYRDPPGTCAPSIDSRGRHSSKIYDHSKNKSSLSLKLSKLFGIDRDRDSHFFLSIDAESSSLQTLLNYSDVFRSFWCPESPSTGVSVGDTDEHVQTKRWLQERLKSKEDVFLVTAIRTVTNATVTVHTSSDTTAALKMGIPLSEMASHGLSSLGDISALDVMIAASAIRGRGLGETYTLKEESVVAVAYRKVRAGKRNDGEVSQAEPVLGEVSWEWLVGTPRGAMLPDNAPLERPIVTVSLGEMVDSAQIAEMNEKDSENTNSGNRNDEEDEEGIDSVVIDDITLLF